MSNTPIPYTPDLTFEKVWAMFRETDKKFQETDRKIEKLSETLEKYAEERREATKNLNEQIQKTSTEMHKAIGELSNRFGEVAEHLVAPGIAARLNELGYHFDTVFEHGLKISENGQVITEVDVLLENEKTIAAVEIKVKPTVHDVKRHLKRMETVRQHFERLRDPRKIFIGGIAGAVFPNAAKDAAIKAGFYVFTQCGDTITIDVPNGFKPREF
ncbi:MAG: DUF3782 domain-containing protein [Planctomycetaceae bacterium]|jgi:anion-transporting  ArsA/GET3 family ATPase|nr:DUF3782 domain-containing protein [Planctomycetaceae bacterium]